MNSLQILRRSRHKYNMSGSKRRESTRSSPQAGKRGRLELSSLGVKNNHVVMDFCYGFLLHYLLRKTRQCSVERVPDSKKPGPILGRQKKKEEKKRKKDGWTSWAARAQ